MTMRWAWAGVALALSSGPVQAGSIPGAVATGPAATAFTVGRLHLSALRDALHVVPNDGSIFGVEAGVPAVTQAPQAAGRPIDKVTLSVDALLVRLPGHVVLIDTGYGPRGDGSLLQSLAQAGVSPDQVTDVLITHSHPDHAGGLATAEGRSAFPNAVIHMSAPEWAWMQTRAPVQPIARAVAGQVKTFKPGDAVLPGITSVPLDGHTPGHVGYEITSDGQRLLDIGDISHSTIVSLGHPDWAIGFDNDRVRGREQREAELARLAASGEEVFSPHFPYPGVGRIVKARSAYAWAPALPPVSPDQ